MATLKWKAANIYRTTNSTETNSTSIIPTSAVTYALAQSIDSLGDGDMYLTSFISFNYTGTGSGNMTNEITIDCTSPISGYTPIMVEIYNGVNTYSLILTKYAYLVGNTAYVVFVSSNSYDSIAYARVIYKKD